MPEHQRTMKWQTKAALQGFLSLVPYGRSINLALQERLGEIDRWNARESLDRLLPNFATPLLERYGRVAGLRVLEIGTGWIPALPVLLGMLGGACRTFDVVHHLNARRTARTIAELGSELEAALRRHGLDTALVRRGERDATARRNAHSPAVSELLAALDVRYQAPVDTRRLPIADASQDVVVSNLTLQHIPPGQLDAVLTEHHRVLVPGGLAIHRINLHDEYASVDPSVTSINFLRYPDWFWEAFGNNRIKYVNRQRYPFYVQAFERAGFEIVKLRKMVDEEAQRALSRMSLAAEFQAYSNEALCTIQMAVVLEKRTAPHATGEA